MPLFYHFNRNFTILPGTIQTDVHHKINQQVLFHTKKKEIVIERGTPFALYIPYKRETLDFEVIMQGKEEEKDLIVSDLHINTKFSGGYKNKAEKFCPMSKKST
jgi:hypothetical protein